MQGVIGVRPAAAGLLMIVRRRDRARHIAQVHVQFSGVGVEGKAADVAEDREHGDPEEKPICRSESAPHIRFDGQAIPSPRCVSKRSSGVPVVLEAPRYPGISASMRCARRVSDSCQPR